MTVRESPWDDDSRLLALAYVDLERNTCACGGQIDETTDPATEGRWRVPLPTRCHRCTALAIAQDEDRPHPGALLWSAELET